MKFAVRPLFFVSAFCLLCASGCGGGDSSKLQCAADETEASVMVEGSTFEGCFALCENGECAPDFRCQQDICIPNDLGVEDRPNNINNSNNGNNLNNANNLNNQNNENNLNNGGENNAIDPDAEEACEQACDVLYGSCITDNCTLTSEDTSALDALKMDCLENLLEDGRSCAEAASADADLLAGVRNVASQTCDAVSDLRCGDFGLTEECGCDVPSDLGGPCESGSDCQGGDLSSGCIPELDTEGEETGFPGGYCFAFPCPLLPDRMPPYTYRSSACGDSGLCRVFSGQGGPISVCEPSGAACTREGYAPSAVGLESNASGDPVFIEACDPECSMDSECGTGGFCDPETSACLVECSTSPISEMAGSPSLADVCSNSGGVCVSAIGSEFCRL